MRRKPENVTCISKRRLQVQFRSSGPLRQSLVASELTEVMGIVNGTTNYILTRMTEDGMGYEEALALATKLGYAESDPTADVEGTMQDARWRLCIDRV